MGSSPENTLSNFDLDLFFCSASTSITENNDNEYQVQNVGMAGSKFQNYQVQNLGITGSTNHGCQTQITGNVGNQGYEAQNIGITSTTNIDYQIQNMGSLGTSIQDYQFQNGGTINHGYQVQNMRSELSFSSQDKVVKMIDYIALKSHLQKINADFTSLQNDYDSKNKDYEAIKKQYARLASDYANLHKENKEHAMASLNINTKCESLEQKEVEYLSTINILNKQCEKYSLDIFAQNKQFIQYQSHVDDLRAEISNLKNNVKSEKNNGKDSRKMISTLTNNNKTLSEHLCLFACVIEGRKQLDKETSRFIKKYCKKSTSNSKKSIETESFENQSVDTGRGSSLAFSDGDRSFYSPSYSITYSPLHTATTPQSDQMKVTRDASSSPPPLPESIHTSTSPIIFEVAHAAPSIQTCDVATNTMIIHHEAKQNRDIATSPTKFDNDDTRTQVTQPQSWSITRSPVEFDDSRTPVADKQMKTLSPIDFEDTETSIGDSQSWSITTSPVKFDDTKTPVSRTKTVDSAISPILFADMEPLKPKTLNTATSPIIFEDTITQVNKTQTSNIATSPIFFEDRARVSVTETSNIATSPIKFDDLTSAAMKTKTSNIATSPILFDDTRTPVCVTETSNIATSPILFEDTNISISRTETSNIATSPIEFDEVTNRTTRTPVCVTETSNIATSPILFEDTNISISRTETSNIATSPIEFDEVTNPTPTMRSSHIASHIVLEDKKTPVTKPKTRGTRTPVSKTKPVVIVTSPTEYTDNKNPIVKTGQLKPLDMGSPEAVTTTSKMKPTKRVKTSALKTNTLDNARSPYLKDVKEGSTISQTYLKSNNNSHINKITEKLKEIVSKQADPSQDAENDWEIKMILSKQKLNWGLLSPLALSPEFDQETTQQTQSEKKNESTNEKNEQSCLNNKNENMESHVLAQSLHLFGNDDSDDENDSDNIASDYISHANSTGEREGIKDQNTTSHIDNIIVFKSPDKISNKPIKARGKLTKYKKLTNLQKIYKANVPKCKIKSQLLPFVKQHEKKPRAHSIPAFKSPVITHKEKEKNIGEFNAKLSLHKRQDAADKVSRVIKSKYNNKEPPTLPESEAKNISTESQNETSKPNTQETPPKSNLEKRVYVSKETPLKANTLSHPQVNPPEVGKKKKISNIDLPHAQKHSTLKTDTQKTPAETPFNSLCGLSRIRTNPLPASCTVKRDSKLTETLSNSITTLPHSATIPLSVTTKKSQSSEESNSKGDLSRVQTNQPSEYLSLREFTNKSDVVYTYPIPTVKRISRVSGGISSSSVLPISQAETNINERINITGETINCNDSDDKRQGLKRPANDLVDDNELDIKRKKTHFNKSQMDANMETSEIDELIDDNKTSSNNNELDASLEISKPNTPGNSDVSNKEPVTLTKPKDTQTRDCADYNDIGLFTDSSACSSKKHNNNETAESWTHNLMDRMIYKYGANFGNVSVPKCEDNALVLTIKTGIAKCLKYKSKQDEYAEALQQLVQKLLQQGNKIIISALMKFLNEPVGKESKPKRHAKRESTEPSASPTEMALIDVIQELEKCGVVLWDLILDSSEFILFTLDRGAAPSFDVVDSVAHFYASICRYRRNMSRLWMFMLNAMYCLSFKAIPIIKHCLDVVPEVIPNSTRYLEPGLSPLIRCLVFLLNFYPCEDPYKRVDEIRQRLRYKYHYNLQDENETTLLFLLKQSIVNLTEKKLERDMLELSFLIVAKRRGTKWCHKNIVQRILLPMIKGEIDVSYRAKRFCITTIGYIVKPYNSEMSIHTEEVVNLLIKLFDQESQVHEMKEDIIRGLIYMDMKTMMVRLNTCLLKWNPPTVSPELEEALESYVRKKNMKSWLTVYQNHYKEI